MVDVCPTGTVVVCPQPFRPKPLPSSAPPIICVAHAHQPMEAHQLCVYVDHTSTIESAQCNDDGGLQLCSYGDTPPSCFFVPCSLCQRAVPIIHPVYAVGRACDSCVSTALASHTVFAISVTTTPPSSSSDFGDSVCGETAQTHINDLERDHPELTPPVEETRPVMPPRVEGYHMRGVEPMAAPASQSEQRLFEKLTRIFFASKATPWPPEKETWLKVARSRYLGRSLLPVPAIMAQLAEQLMYIFPAGLIVIYIDKLAVHHHCPGNEVERPSIGSAISQLRKKPGLCALIYAGQTYVGVVEVLTHPEQTQQGAGMRSVVEDAAARLPWLGRRQRQKLRRQRY